MAGFRIIRYIYIGGLCLQCPQEQPRRILNEPVIIPLLYAENAPANPSLDLSSTFVHNFINRREWGVVFFQAMLPAIPMKSA
jgi:hypothetical protein